MKPSILILDDEAAVRTSFALYLAKKGFAVTEAGSLAEARQAMMAQSVDGLLLDVRLPDGSGLDWIREVREAQPGTAIVVMTGIGDIPMAVQAMREGADHFVTKPVNMTDLEVFLRKSLELGGLRRGSRAVRRLAKKAAPFFGDCPAASALSEQARLALQHDAPVLLQGETGTGKGVLARWIHEHGSRDGMPFVEVSCAGLPRDLLASELFGHARGAFTSAVTDKDGLLDVADGGTLFLDEIGELDGPLQSQFLTVLEEKRYRRLGEVRERRSEFRLICATSRVLTDEVASGRFRPSKPGPPKYQNVFADTLIRLAREDERIIAITAAMADGTGLDRFKKVFPERFYDVGIAEQHAVTFAAGLAAEGMKPVPAIYSTFLQRAYDQVVHDVCLQNLDVTFALDRAGLVGADGATHQGAYDFAYLRTLPNLILMAPKDENELQHMLRTAIEHPGPAAVRFPRGEGFGVPLDPELKALPIGEAELLR
ncbi:MAG TPA: sigma 54-interacting transcriptional regulator, partial [Candidatus Limnocylindrales bacterium]